jgi:aminocarboxymuconate-semialdehyde decarboxylase
LIIDCHCHVVVPELATSVPDSVVGEFTDVDKMLAEASARGVDYLVLSPWIRLASQLPEVQNRALSSLAAAHQGRISALGAVPLEDPAAAADCLAALMTLPGMCGAEIPASVGGRYLGDPAFEPFWAAAEHTSAVIFVHPTTTGFGLEPLRSHYLWNSVGNPMETAVTAAHMIVAGVLERHPGLKVLLAHGGGGLLALRGRLRRAFAVRPEARSRSADGPDASLRRFYYDSLTHDRDLLAGLVGLVGADHVVLGSDQPFDMGSDDPVGEIRGLGLGAETDLVLGGNAARLLGLAG